MKKNEAIILTNINKTEIERCENFIKDNFLQMPSVKSVSIYSLFFSGGTFTDEEVIKQALKNVMPSQLYKRN
tara:strand:+ start:478 stop:693 length:216 start_codon:yes stop_codon:yes gene_type:complete